MAIGDVTVFAKYKEDVGDKLHNMSGDTFKIGLVDSVTTPTETISDPRWGAGGGTNFATNEVTPGGNYSAGGPSLSVTITDNWSLSTATAKFDGDDVSILVNASNPTDARWGIIYNDTDAGKRAVGFIDLGSVIDLTAGDFTITWNAAGIFTLA